MEKDRIAYLLKRYQYNSASHEELQEWYTILQNNENDDVINRLVDASYDEISDVGLETMERGREEEIFSAIVGSQDVRETSFHPLWKNLAIAASVLLITFSGAVLFLKTGTQKTENLSIAAGHIHPGKQGATLTLANGRQIKLDNLADGEVASEKSVRIKKKGFGQIIYEPHKLLDVNSERLNTLTTTYGETYMVILPDRSKVWLNSASELIYPTSFARQPTRLVELKGEAYFEISKDKLHPFKVKSYNQEITVLGTHFDVNSYADNGFAKTTLLEGKVAISMHKNGKNLLSESSVLQPNQQALITEKGIRVTSVEASDAIAWKNGYFLFNNEELGTIMNTLSRWYNTTIVYDDETLKKEVVFAKLSRYESISKILKLLERTDKIRFKVDGNTVTISRAQRSPYKFNPN